MLPFPGPDTRTASLPGPDAHTVPFPGADARAVGFPSLGPSTVPFPGPDMRAGVFPPPPLFVVELLAPALGGGVASAAIVIVPWRHADAVGGGVAEVASVASVAFAAPALGGGLAWNYIVNAIVDADAVGGGIAAAAVLVGHTLTAPALGGGTSGVVGYPIAAVAATATAVGAGNAAITPGALVPAAANGGGIAAAVNTRTARVSAATVGGGTVAAGVSVGYRYADAFNRSDATTLGADWRVDRNPQPKIATNRAQMKTMGSGDGRAGNWVSYQGGGGTAAGRFNTDNYAVKAQLIAPVGNLATDNLTCIVLAVADTFGAATMCYLAVSTNGGCGIITQTGLPPASGISSGGSGQTVRVSTSTAIAATDLFEFRRVGNVFTAYRNGAQFLTWPDTGNIVPTGTTNRRWGLVVEGNFPIFNTEYRSPAIDWIEAYDL